MLPKGQTLSNWFASVFSKALLKTVVAKYELGNKLYNPTKMVPWEFSHLLLSLVRTYIHMCDYSIFMIGPFNTMINSRIEQGWQLLEHSYFQILISSPIPILPILKGKKVICKHPTNEGNYSFCVTTHHTEYRKNEKRHTLYLSNTVMKVPHEL
jgi:hypothetical protein